MSSSTPEPDDEVDSYKDILEELIDELINHDSLGVHGSGFKFCHVCEQATEPGSGDEINHDEDCPVSTAIQRAIELERTGAS